MSVVMTRPTADVIEQPSWDRAAVRWWGCLALLVVLALILRLMAIGFHSFWFDEAFTASVAEAGYWDILRGAVRDDGNPPLYYLAAKAWSEIFGRSEVAFRSFPTLMSLCTLPLLALLGRQFFGTAAGLLAGLFWAISPLGVELANEARAYALLQFLAVFNTWFFLRWDEHRRRTDFWVYVVGVTLSLYTHYYAPAVPLAHGLALLVGQRERRQLLAWLGGMAVAGLLYAPWLPVFVAQLTTPGNLSRGGSHWWFQFLSTPIVFGLGRTFAWRDSTLGMLALATVAALIGFLVPAIWGAVKLVHRPFTGTLLVGWLLIPILGPLVVALTVSPIYTSRYASLGIPAFLLLIVHGLMHMSPLSRRVVLGMALVATSVSLVRYDTEPLKDDWRSAVRTLQERWQPGTPILFDGDIETVSFLYYARPAGIVPERMVGLTLGPANAQELAGVAYDGGNRTGESKTAGEAALQTSAEAWLALCVPARTPEQYVELLGRRGFRLTESHHFQRVSLLHFSRRIEIASERGR